MLNDYELKRWRQAGNGSRSLVALTWETGKSLGLQNAARDFHGITRIDNHLVKIAMALKIPQHQMEYLADDVWDSATDTAKAAVSRATESMAAVANLAMEVAKAAKSATIELVDRGVGTARAVRDKVVDTYHSIKREFSLWRASNVPVQDCSASGRTLGALDCPGLAQEENKIAQTQTKAKLAAATYQEPGQQDLPESWSRATDAELKDLGLMDAEGRKLTEIPDSDFRAEVFKDPDGETVVAF